MRATTPLLALIVGATLAACSSDPQLMNLSSTDDGPDEFSIAPARTLTMPPDLNALPTPVPGGTNRTDRAPKAEAIAALGGNPAALAAGGVPASDGALVAYASRAGLDPTIRPTLAAEDLAWRSAHGRKFLEIIAGNSVYYRAYERMTLDSERELVRWRRAGARVPSAPPAAR